MPLPNWDGDGLLPAGIHAATLDDIRERCVLDVADAREWREALHAALIVYIAALKRIIPAGKMWVDGGFMTAKSSVPFDIDVVLFPSDWSALDGLDEKHSAAMFGALTLQDVIVGEPILSWLPRIQPVCGALDAFLCWPGQEVVWRATWESVKADDGSIVAGVTKGFAEVTW